MGPKLRGYCHQCNEPKRTGYCSGATEKRHPPEPIPPCSGCKGPCDWATGRGCRRFTIQVKHAKKDLVDDGMEWAATKRVALRAEVLSEVEEKQMTSIGRLFDRLFGKGRQQ